MIKALEIYGLTDENLKMYELTKNTIVLFSDYELKNKFVQEFLDIKNDKIDSDTCEICHSTISDNKVDKQTHKVIIKTNIVYKPTSIFTVDEEQKFIFTTEAPFILQCKDEYDLWFCNVNKDNEIELYSLIAYKEHKEMWNSGIENIYKMFIGGRIGYYKGYGY